MDGCELNPHGRAGRSHACSGNRPLPLMPVLTSCISSVDIHIYRGFVKPGCRASEDGGTRHHQSVSPRTSILPVTATDRDLREGSSVGSARFYGLRIMCRPEVPSNLALIFRSKISMGFRTYFFRDKYSAPRISPLLASSYPSPLPDSCLLKALNYVPWSVPIPDTRMSPYPVDTLCFLTATHKMARLGSHCHFPSNTQ